MTAVAAHGRLEGDRTVVLALADTPVERGVVDEFAAGRTVAHDPAEAVKLAAANGAEIAPVGVAWLPPERDGGHRFSLRDLRFGDPSKPGARAQERLLSKTPERCRIVVGEPAAVDDLRARWERHSGEAGDGDGFTRFVARQARLAVDRAERSLLGARYKSAHDIVEDLLASRDFRTGAQALGARLGRDTDSVIDEAREYLTELASVQNRFARDVWAQGSKFLWGRAYRMEVDREALERLRELNTRYPLVFLPSHKSNMDGFVMSSVTYENGFPANHIVGGINMGFWPLGPLGRRVGVVWIRRSFGGNEVYKYTLRRYLAYLASKRFNLEWYIEGGRSRTGKLLPPKLGLLNYLAKGAEQVGVEEIMLVPVSIVYDRLNELVETTAQVRGAKKRPEGTGWLIRYARSQRGDMGKVHVRFGEPVPLRDGLAGDDPNALNKVAFEVCARINRATPITPTSLVTLALLGAAGPRGHARAGAGVDRSRAALRRAPRASPERGARDRARARDARRAQRPRALRRRRRARLPDPPRPRPDRRLLPQHQHPLVRQPRDRRAQPRGQHGPRRRAGGGVPAARPAQVRVLLRREGRVPGRAAGRGRPDRPGLAHQGPQGGAGRLRRPLRRPRAALVPRGLRRRGRPARRAWVRARRRRTSSRNAWPSGASTSSKAGSPAPRRSLPSCSRPG